MCLSEFADWVTIVGFAFAGFCWWSSIQQRKQTLKDIWNFSIAQMDFYFKDVKQSSLEKSFLLTLSFSHLQVSASIINAVILQLGSWSWWLFSKEEREDAINGIVKYMTK